MSNIVRQIEKKQIEKLSLKKRIPPFRTGDTLKITVKIVEGERSRLQAFEGVCIARKNNGVNSKFTVRKISHGEGVERVFPLFSPIVDKIEIIRKGEVRRAKLYYLRNRTGKKARISDSDRVDGSDQYSYLENLEQPNKEDNNNTNAVADEVTKEKDSADDSLLKDNLENDESSQKNKIESVTVEKKPNQEKSKSSAAVADKTKDDKTN